MATDMADTGDTMAVDTDTTEARGLPHLKPHLKPMLMPKPPLMPGTDTMVVDTDMVPDTMVVTVVVTDTVWDTTDTDTVWDTVATTDTDIPVLTVMPTTTARGPLIPNPLLKLKPHPRPMLK